MADRIILSIRMDHFSGIDRTSPDSPWSVELNTSIQHGNADHIILSVRNFQFFMADGPVWTVLGPSRQYGWLIVSAYQ